MMAKITKGHDFGGAIRYVMQEKKEARLLDSKGVLATDRQSIIGSFCFQAQFRPNVKNVVCHISLDFSVEDVDKMTDEFMVRTAQEYMLRMNIQNTQYILVRHFDREHPHCHIIFNRIANTGKVISDRNDRVRSARICRSLTAKHGLHIACGKDHVHRERLRGADAVKYQIYDALEAVFPKCRNWEELRMLLAQQGITMSFTCRGTTTDIQGVVFEKDGLRFNGSKIDRKYSYSKITAVLYQNAMHHRTNNAHDIPRLHGNSDYNNRPLQHDYPSEYRVRKTEERLREPDTDTFEHTHSATSAVSELLTDVASGVSSDTGSAVSGVVNALIATPSSPDVSSGGGGGSNSSDDLDDDYYIDENGIRRRKHRGMRR